MTDEKGATVPESPETSGAAGPGTDDTWDDLGRQLSDLGSAVARVVRAAVNDPESRRRAREIKAGLESMARDIGVAVDDAVDTPQGQRVKGEVSRAAESVAAAGRRMADDIRPRLIGAARTVSEKLRETASDMEQRAQPESAPEAPPVKDDSAETETKTKEERS